MREFFEFSINRSVHPYDATRVAKPKPAHSILYQRGVYPPETFKRVAKYGLGMMVTTDEGLCDYLKNVLEQLESWLRTGEVQRLVVVVTGVDTNKTLERWVFAIKTERDKENSKPIEHNAKSTKDITAEIQAIVRQITASVTFLPLLNEPCAFDLLIYTRSTSNVPESFEDCDPRYIANGSEVKLRSFTTSIHQIHADVEFAQGE